LSDVGWIEYVQWTNDTGEPIASFSSTWVVPTAPASDDGQIVYLFNGLQHSSDGPFILQPVLQWGASPAGGGNFWSITNWFVDGQGGLAIFANNPLVRVNQGDVLQGIMTLTSQSGKSFSYLSSFAGFPSVDLTVTDIDELQWACETLECYGATSTTPLTQCSDYPNTVFTAVYDIELKVGQSLSTATDTTIDWQATTNFTDCGQKCEIVSNDFLGGAVYLYYRQWKGALLEFFKEPNPAPWQIYNHSNDVGGVLIGGNPFAVFDSAGSAHVFARGTDGSLLEFFKEPNPAAWQVINHSNDVKGVLIAGDPFAVFDSGGSAHVFARGTDGSLLEFFKEPNPAVWQVINHSNDVGGVLITGNPFAVFDSGGSAHVFARGAGGILLEFFKEPNPAAWLAYNHSNDVGALIEGDPFAVFDSGGSAHVFAQSGA
jgi:hypothetical protein